MSTFLGLVEEIPGISVDRFDDKNLESTAYFLSHCHTDHMNGLSVNFFNRLEEKQHYLYCTALSKAFLEGKYKLSESQSEKTIKTIEACSPVIVDYTSPKGLESITVLCVSAGHCPGSVMFIFETPNSSILYTGDFRICLKDLQRLKPLHDKVGARMLPKRFDKIYLDTTFLNEQYREFPSREQSLSEISRAAKDWISKDPRNIVSLECSANYGSEYVYMELANSLKKRVHVKSWVYESYSRIPELERCITNDPNITPVHACVMKTNKGGFKCRPDVSEENILTIVPSAWRWKGIDLSKGISLWDSDVKNRFYVCTSMHCSFNELKAFLDYFKPSAVHGCVESDEGKECVQDTLDEIMNKCNERVCESESREVETFELRSLKRPRIESKYFSEDSSD